MKTDLLTIILGFFEGFALIISPCILPVLPIILAGSLAGSRKRPLGIIAGFTLFFALAAYFSRQLVYYLGIDLNTIRHIAYALLLILGLIMISSWLTERFNRITQVLARTGTSLLSGTNSQGGFFSGFVIGGLVALVWTPCAGPILAAVIVQTVMQKTNITSFFTLLAFGLGAVVPMFIIALYGIKIMNCFNFFKQRTLLLRKILGMIIIASVAYMMYFDGTLISPSTAQTQIKTATVLENGLWHTYPAPKIAGIEAWINSSPLQISNLKGKVVLVDFWTYSCINCVRTLPYLKDWYQKYHHKGLVIIGVHTPEFDFEKILDNVKSAVARDRIRYPVALDNQFTTWNNYSNHYWPAHYLINKNGDVVYEHFGEGNYDVTENNIRFLLGIDNVAPLSAPNSESYFYTETPETYLGYARADSNLSPEPVKDKVANYQFPAQLVSNAWGLQGEWQINSDNIVAAQANAALKIHFNARKVYLVMGNNSAKPIKVKVLLNGEPLFENQGRDVTNSSILVDKYSIYAVIEQKQFASGFLQVIATEPGIKIYTITFGN